MDYNHSDDQTLLQLIALREPEALGALYDRYHRLVYSIAMAVTQQRNAAEDITLEVFEAIWERVATYDVDRGKATTWMCSMARHRAIDYLRRQGVRPEGNSVTWAEVWPEPASEERLEEEAELALQRRRVREAIGHLPQEQKETLVLAYFSGYSQQEIAKIMRQPLGTVKTRIRLAMQKLRDFLHGDAD